LASTMKALYFLKWIFSLAPLQLLRPQTFSLVGKFCYFDNLSTSSVFLFFIFPLLYVALIWANHLQFLYHKRKYVFIINFWSLRLLNLFFKNKKLCFNFQPCGCHSYVMLHKLSLEMHFKKVWKISFLNTSKKTLYPHRLLGVKCTTYNNSIHTGYLCVHLIFHSIIIDLLIPSPTHKYKIRIVNLWNVVSY